MSTKSAPGGHMTVIEHLVELRRRLIRAVVALGAGAVACWVLYPHIFAFLVDPYCRSLSEEARAAAGALGGDECRLLQRDPLEGFSIRLLVSIYGGLALAVPVILWQAWGFIAPGLYKHERRWVLPFVACGAALFAAGAGLAYWSIPRALRFLNEVGGPDLVQVYSPRPYLDFVTKMIIAFGVGFQFPLVLCFLQMIGLVKPDTLRRGWRYAVVGVVTLVAVITPSGDPVTLIVLSVPMYIFYEASIVFGRVWQRRQRRLAEASP